MNPASPDTLRVAFPLARTHDGPALGNGRHGVMIWGGGRVLRLTLGRAGHWDHRGCRPWPAQVNYPALRRRLEAGDAEGAKALFASAPAPPGTPPRSSLLPVGRFELEFPAGWELDDVKLDLATGEARVRLHHPADGAAGGVTLLLGIDKPDTDPLWIGIDSATPAPRLTASPMWDRLGAHYASLDFAPPSRWDEPGDVGWVQLLPADPALAVGARRDASSSGWWVLAAESDTPANARAALHRWLAAAQAHGPAALRAGNVAWWSAYWARLPRVALPNARLAALLRHGHYKFAGLTHPHGVPATLQGPWVEDTRRPPWNGDYHFNVNVQLGYAPALPAGLPDHLEPLLCMIDGWAPLLRDNAHAFVGIDDGVLLQHATDDRGETSLLFWTGAIDHACTAWVGRLLYQHWQYTGDDSRLRRFTLPFLRGALRVFEEMLAPTPDGQLALPVGVSPEYRGAAPDAWGRDATFQLVACHWLIEALTEIHVHLGEAPEPRWADIAARLPRHTLHGEPGKEQIALWSGLPLGESHRHHSHLGGLWPFDTLDHAEPGERALIRRTLDTWTTLGMGKWAGWSLPWAAMIHARTDNGAMAEAMLELWERLFTNPGGATLHDPIAPGFTRIGRKWERGAGDDIMQAEAGMGAVAAIYEMLVHARRGVLHLFAGVPPAWSDVSFEDIHTEAGVRVSAWRVGGRVTRVRLVAVRAVAARLASPWSKDPRSAVLVFNLTKGETREIEPA